MSKKLMDLTDEDIQALSVEEAEAALNRLADLRRAVQAKASQIAAVVDVKRTVEKTQADLHSLTPAQREAMLQVLQAHPAPSQAEVGEVGA